jgi:malonate transporter
MLLGYLAAKHHDFGPQEASILIRMVMTYALPVALFVGTVSRTRGALLQDLPLLIVLTVAIVGLYVVVLLVCRGALRLSLGRSALAALAASAPNVGFVGPTVLGSLYGAASGLPVALGNLVIVLTVVPLTVILLSLDANARVPVSASLLGVILVLSGRPLPTLLIDALTLLGQSASGVALFAAGIILAVHHVRVTGRAAALAFIKNIAEPGLVWVSLYVLGYRNPLLGEAVVTTALPVLVTVAMLAVQYQVAEAEAASTLFIGMGSSLLTVAGFIALTGA